MPTLADREVSNNGLGLMRLTTHGANIPDEDAFAVLKAAISAGVNCWNGADFYGTPTNNSLHLLSRYFAAYPEDADKVVICIKSGIVDMRTFSMDCSPESVRKFVANANSILGDKKKIDIFGMARVDPKVPLEDTIKTLADLVSEGAIGGIQLSEVGPETIRRAASIAKIDMVEAEVSLWATEIFDNGVAATCDELNIPIVAHTPLGAGMLTGKLKSLDDMEPNDYHRFFPRFQPENFHKNLELVDELNKLARSKECTPAQLALNWIKQQSKKSGIPPLIPVFGARAPDRVVENTKEVDLTDKDLEEIEKILASFPVAGTRYPAPAMKLVEF
ncbi:putative aldo/keto reductase [Xylaria longipes]|nr:putative aldo/keto reductase [Xylaria longipes]